MVAKMIEFRLTLAIAAGLCLFGAGAASASQVAQYPATASGPSQFREDPSVALARHLRTLAVAPQSLDALIGAGNAALELGDAESAISFFGRAEEVAPRDGRAKAGIGSGFILLEQPRSALKFFDDAVDLGVPESAVARDRGLAYDLRGDPRRAQKDYALVLARGEDLETRRRMALSLAISGDRPGALAMLEDQLQRQDRVAWRTRAFVLALTGDADEATHAMQAVMPAQAAMMRPFFARLPQLNPEQRALAVHFGHFPGEGRAAEASDGVQFASLSPEPTQAGRPDASQSALGRAAPAPVSTAPHRTAVAKTPTKPAPAIRFADVAAAIEALPGADEGDAPVEVKTKAKPAKAAAKAAPKPVDPKLTFPKRHWAQIAVAEKSELRKEYKRLKGKAPKLFADKSSWTVPMGSTNRLLVGPFESESEARSFVNALAKESLESFSWTSPAGQEIDKLPTK